jgi:hypothetical protein
MAEPDIDSLPDTAARPRSGAALRRRATMELACRLRLACAAIPPMLALSTVAAAGPADVKPFSALYSGTKLIAMLPATARARLDLHRNGAWLRYTMRTSVSWTLIERRFLDCSVMRIEGDRLLPVEFRHIDESEARRNVTVRYDWGRQLAHIDLGAPNAKPSTETVPIEWPTWDAMSLQVALMAAAPQIRAGARDTIRVIGRGGVRSNEVEFIGPDARVADPDGPPFRIVSRRGDRETQVWLLPRQGWQLVHLTIDGVTIERTGVAPASPAPSASDIRECPAQAAP